MKKNLGNLDKLIRLTIAILVIIIWIFWTYWILKYVLFLAWAVFIIVSILWYCPLYQIFNFDTMHFKISSKLNIIFIFLIVILWFWWIYWSIFFTNKFFIEDFTKFNNEYKLLLFNTWKENRNESIEFYEKTIKTYSEFQKKYSNYLPYSLRNDIEIWKNLNEIQEIIFSLKDSIYSWNLQDSHIKLEWVRNITQDILKRNWFSMLNIALVDFHDVMEILIESSDEKDAKKIIENYQVANEKLNEVEKYLNNEWVKSIRSNLEILLETAKNSENYQIKKDLLPKIAQDLKSSFIKVYLVN